MNYLFYSTQIYTYRTEVRERYRNIWSKLTWRMGDKVNEHTLIRTRNDESSSPWLPSY